jgi:hypothetical protein
LANNLFQYVSKLAQESSNFTAAEYSQAHHVEPILTIVLKSSDSRIIIGLSGTHGDQVGEKAATLESLKKLAKVLAFAVLL